MRGAPPLPAPTYFYLLSPSRPPGLTPPTRDSMRAQARGNLPAGSQAYGSASNLGIKLCSLFCFSLVFPVTNHLDLCLAHTAPCQHDLSTLQNHNTVPLSQSVIKCSLALSLHQAPCRVPETWRYIRPGCNPQGPHSLLQDYYTLG